ncbi:MAG TPA: kelch repeat-containing protein [Candidatus Acidoferrum sp.]|nr:kelch repeat-containing protein [Candidatus Acidoferrum sp.]
MSPGTWYQLPSNCHREVVLTYLQCAQWGINTFTECVETAVHYLTECVQWVWQQVTKCGWAFLLCVILAIVATLVCAAVEVIAVVVCAVIVLIEWILCLLWTLVSITFCLTYRYGGTAFLLTDGTVMMQEWQIAISPASEPTRRWWKLTPDQFGDYAKGKWSKLADSNVARAAFASAVLADGRVVICGGEYSDASGSLKQDDTNTCEIYDPVANTWTAFGPPADGMGQVWKKIGDAPCALLQDGTLLLGSMANPNVAKLDPATLTWTAMRSHPMVNSNAEDSWVLMPDNTVVAPSCNSTNPQTTWVYHVASNQWLRGNDLPTNVVEALDPHFVAEIGPGLLLYDGTSFFLGGNQHTAVYSATANPQWSNGPDLPDQEGLHIGILDGPGALLVNGNILFGAGFPGKDAAGPFSEPCFYFEFDGSMFYKTNDPPNSNCYTMDTRLLLLPNGDVMFFRDNDSSFYAYRSPAIPQDSFRPVIQSCPAAFAPGSTIQISGLQFNGLSQAVAYGDDSQTATNYPLVRIVNKQSNHVRYCRTFNHTTVDGSGNTVPSTGVATGAAVITTNVEIPGDFEQGDAQLFVVANGIPSQPFDVTITTLF